MTLEDVMREVEDHRFAAEANLVSGSRAFHDGIRNNCTFRKLMEHATKRNVPDIILKRIIELAKKPVDPSFENPYDTALTTYLTTLDIQSPELAKRGAKAISGAMNCWWATELSLRLLARVTQGQMALPSSQPGANVTTLGEMVHVLLGDARTIRVVRQEYDVNAATKLGATDSTPYRIVPSGRRTVIRYRKRRHGRVAFA